MQMNLSEKTVKTVINALKDKSKDLRRQMETTTSENRREILDFMLRENEEALDTFEEFYNLF